VVRGLGQAAVPHSHHSLLSEAVLVDWNGEAGMFPPVFFREGLRHICVCVCVCVCVRVCACACACSDPMCVILCAYIAHDICLGYIYVYVYIYLYKL
jgi:hypothetical protein